VRDQRGQQRVPVATSPQQGMRVGRRRWSQLRRSLEAHPGDTPVHVRLDARRGPRFFALDRCPVEVTPMLLGELKGIRGIGVVREAG
jgi:hypothetical protein